MCQSAKGDANGYAAVVYLYAADIVLEQSAGPTASNVGGELASAPAVSGMSDVTFNASDPGAGVYETTFNVDGKVVQSTVPNEDGGRCRNVGQTTDGLAAFLYLQPCPQTESVDVPFDTTALSNGAHHLVVSVIDRGGQLGAGARPGDRRGQPDPPPPRPAAAERHERLQAGDAGGALEEHGEDAHLTQRWGERETITGRLTAPGGVPIAGASIDLTATPEYTGAKPLTMASPRTGPDGRFAVSLPRGESSRSLTFAYRAHLGDARPAAARTLTLSVRAGVSLSVAPRRDERRAEHLLQRRAGGRAAARGRQAAGARGALAGGGVDRVRRDPHGREGPLPGELSLQVPGPRALPVPGPVEVRGGLPVPGSAVERGGSAGAMSAGPG